jgi:MFS family permease
MDIISKKERPHQTFTRLALILFFIEWIRGAVLIAFLPTYVLTSWGHTTSVVGIAVSVHYLTDSLIKSFIGYLLDRYPGRTVLHGGFFLGFVGLLMMVTTHSPWMLIVASACLGAGFSPIWILCMSQVSEENRAQQMGALSYTGWLV